MPQNSSYTPKLPIKLFYLANIRMPTEKAHGLQITQMCEAFAQASASVTLIASRRYNSPEMTAIKDIYSHYGVERNFAIERMACIDLFPLGKRTEKFAFYLEVITYTLFLAFSLLFRQADIYYTRDIPTLLILSLFKPRKSLAFEAHQLAKSSLAVRMQSLCVRRAGTVITITAKLAEELQKLGASHTVVAHDGFQSKRFANLPDQQSARKQTNFPADAFIVGYVGRLHTMTLSKGVDKLIEAIGTIPEIPISICIVGGPDDMAKVLYQRWLELGLPADRFLFPGQVRPDLVPVYIATFDVSAMSHPDTEHFRYYTSPLKLFEYMAAGQPILGTNLPSIAEVLTSEVNGLLVPPDDIHAMAQAIMRLYNDVPLRERLGKTAKDTGQQYSWQGRAEYILKNILQPYEKAN